MVGAEVELVQEVLGRAGEDGDVIALDPSVDALERLEAEVRDPRLWFLLGDSSPDVERVLR